MRRRVALLLVASLAGQPLWLTAQAPVPAPRPQQPAAPSSEPVPTVESLGVSFDRIKRELRIVPASSAKTPLKLEYYVEVLGIAPEIQLFAPEELRGGPVPGGAPTHWEMVHELWTKPEFKSPSVPIGSLAILGIMKLAQWQTEQAKKRKAEAERRARDEELKRKYPDIVKKEEKKDP
jgi:hypothetical protein